MFNKKEVTILISMKAEGALSQIFSFRSCFTMILISFNLLLQAQQPDYNEGSKRFIDKSIGNFVSENKEDIFGTSTAYIENIGQYAGILHHSQMGNVLFGYEGFGLPVLFTPQGLIHFQQEMPKISYGELKSPERKEISKQKLKERLNLAKEAITMEWIGASSDVEIIAQEIKPEYHIYGFVKGKARAYKKILYKDLYPGIDVEFSFIAATKIGYEYKVFIKPGADMSLFKMKFTGKEIKINIDQHAQLRINSDIDEIVQSAPVCYYTDSKSILFRTEFEIINNEISFKSPANFDNTKTMVIDPFVSTTVTLSGTTSGIAKDIDYDYSGSIYVVGGGDNVAQKMAKFDENGILKWTFSGSLNAPDWNFGTDRGGWAVDKATGAVYIGQGVVDSGFRIIRLNNAGIYDNYVTKTNVRFTENWKMLWICDGNIPKLFIAGGGNLPNELGLLSPPDINLKIGNISGQLGGNNDISDIAIDPTSNAIYTHFSVPYNAAGSESSIFKHNEPYISNAASWAISSGYEVLTEPNNRPYLNGFDNSSNSLAVNAKYLFYWDGKNLKAFDKFSGNPVGLPLSVSANTALMQGGIYADDCNNVYTGSTNGLIKVYKFNGNTFDDLAATDIKINGINKAVYDIVYDNRKKIIYACGDNFVASVVPTMPCSSISIPPLPLPFNFSVSVSTDNYNLSATAIIFPNPPGGSIVTYLLHNGTALLTTNTTGIFNDLKSGTVYNIRVVVSRQCVTTQAEEDFELKLIQLPDAGNIYVPNTFTPNADGLNDILKIIVDGIKELHYFRIYNRYGQLVFTTKDPARGWDGKIKGIMQNTGTFVWVAEVVNFNGKKSLHKGTTTLIR